jgi:hypothetical protein
MRVGNLEKERKAAALRRSRGRSKTHMTLLAIAQKLDNAIRNRLVIRKYVHA